jgi:hypothetical protein
MNSNNNSEFEIWENLGKTLIILLCLYGMIWFSDLLPDSITYQRPAYLLIYSIMGILFVLSLVFILRNRKLKSRYAREVENIKSEAYKEVDHPIGIDDISYVIQREGYTPQKGDDEHTVFFNISGQPFEVRYEHECLTIRRHYNIGEDISLKSLRRAAVATEEELYLIKVYVPTHDDGSSSIVFEVPLFICSAKELAHHFPRCLNLLLNSIQRHREIYNELEEKRQHNQEEIETHARKNEAKVLS